jgi:hypothetical protein
MIRSRGKPKIRDHRAVRRGGHVGRRTLAARARHAPAQTSAMQEKKRNSIRKHEPSEAPNTPDSPWRSRCVVGAPATATRHHDNGDRVDGRDIAASPHWLAPQKRNCPIPSNHQGKLIRQAPSVNTWSALRRTLEAIETGVSESREKRAVGRKIMGEMPDWIALLLCMSVLLSHIRNDVIFGSILRC